MSKDGAAGKLRFSESRSADKQNFFEVIKVYSLQRAKKREGKENCRQKEAVRFPLFGFIRRTSFFEQGLVQQTFYPAFLINRKKGQSSFNIILKPFAMLQSINPNTKEVIGSFQHASLEEVDNSLFLAQQGFSNWRLKTFDERSHFLKKLAALLRENKRTCAEIISREMGKVIRESIKEVEKSAMVVDFFAEHGARYLKEEKIKLDEGEGLIKYEPLGVVLGVMPWNFPFWQVFRFAAPTLMAGNAIVLKHSSQVPACCEKIEEMFERAGFPGGVFQKLIIPSAMVENIIKDFRVQAVSFTGSLEAGSKVGRFAGEEIKKSVLELGGSDPFIVLEDADIKTAAKAGVSSRMKNFGQSCDAAKRFILHESIAEDFLDAMIEELELQRFGDPLDEKSDFAGLSSQKQKDLLQKQVKISLEMGAEVVWEAEKAPDNDTFFKPLILKGITPDMPAYKEELFGPVFSVFIVSDGLEAIRIANNTEFGLGASIWTEDLVRGWKLLREVQAGIVSINNQVKSRPELPFGGIKKSGTGRELSGEGCREFTNRKSVWYSIE